MSVSFRETSSKALNDFVENLKVNFKSLEKCPKEIYINFMLKFCESYSYFSISQILVIYLHTEFGLSDIQAGGCYGMWGAAITFWGIATSWMNDNLGVRKSLLIGFFISIFATMILALTTSTQIIFFTLFFLMPLGTSMGIPMLTVGIRRYTTKKNRGFAFGLYYSVMNMAAFASGPMVDGLNYLAGDGVRVGGRLLTGNRLIILSASVTTMCSFLLTFSRLREVQITEEEGEGELVRVREGESEGEGEGEGGSGTEMTSNPLSQSSSSISHFSIEGEEEEEEVLNGGGGRGRDRGFKGRGRGRDRGRAESSIWDEMNEVEDQDTISQGFEAEEALDRGEAGARGASLFGRGGGGAGAETAQGEGRTGGGTGGGVSEFVPTHQSLWATLSSLLRSPTFWRFSVFTLLLVNLNAVFRHLDATFPTYLVRLYGPDVPKGMLYSINPFMIIFLTPIVSASTSHLPHFDMIRRGSYVTALAPFLLAMSPSLGAAAGMVILLSLGEAVWSPRVYDYTMSIAPQGREASFSTMAAAPLFLAKVPVGLLSGWVLNTYMSEKEGAVQRPRMLWLVIGLVTASSPLLITLLEPWIREPSPHIITNTNTTPHLQLQKPLRSISHHALLQNESERSRMEEEGEEEGPCTP